MVLELCDDFGQWQHPNINRKVAPEFQSSWKGTCLEARCAQQEDCFYF